ncbi:Dipeptidyl peptidase 2 [Desmophyllum pertusum]|uniref:Dipeptidyl peptidase 2 n=1 Tax=Desmophyllum pertusum TaxID=174260 RepID=A0A9W9ZDF0_9CNID|nr:Dipeptidyl peptidase 2 [Desmophyllum pertusum]
MYLFEYSIAQFVFKDFLNADPDCPGYVVTAFEMLEMLKNQGSKGLAELSRLFKLCKPLESTEQIHHLLGWIRNAFTNLAMGDYPYPTNFLAPLPGHPVNVACKIMASASYKLQGLADVTAMVYNGTNGTLTCLDPDTEYIECADPTGCGLGPDSRALDYQVHQMVNTYHDSLQNNKTNIFQVCSELALHVAGSNNKTDMFSPLPWTPDMIAKYCQEKWGVTKRPGWITTQLWGKDIASASNIIFSNGDLDPWRLGGGIQPSGPAHSNTSPGTRTGIDSKVYTIEGFIENDDKDTESARRIGKVSEEAKLEIDVETSVKSFKPLIMDVVFAWANGASFSQICKMTDAFEGIIKTKRDIVFAASMYL